jgi:exodeoxyribonuclease VII small subunit
LTAAVTLCTVARVDASRGKMTAEEKDLGQLEKSLEELEALVVRLEGGDLSLEQALEEFERGVKLTRQCQTALKAAEQKVEILLKKTESATPVPFSPAAENDTP